MLTYFCPKCYAENGAEDEVCRSCGARLDEETGDYVERLISFSLHHPIPSVTAMAAEALGMIGDERAVEPLIEVLRTSGEPGLLEAAAEALGRLKSDRAVPALQDFMERGTVAARLKAVVALGEIGGDEAAAALAKIAARDPSENVREEARRILDRISEHRSRRERPTGDRAFAEPGEAHKRGILVTLEILDEVLCEAEQWARGREIKSVLYIENNTLSDQQTAGILSEIAEMRRVLGELRDSLGLEPRVQDVATVIRSKCAGLWEHIVELKAKHLRRYGEVPAGLGDYLDPQAERLIQGILRILDTLKRRP